MEITEAQFQKFCLGSNREHIKIAFAS